MSENVDRHYVDMLCSTSAFIDYVDELLQDERSSLNNSHIHQFLCNFFTRVIFSLLSIPWCTVPLMIHKSLPHLSVILNTSIPGCL